MCSVLHECRIHVLHLFQLETNAKHVFQFKNNKIMSRRSTATQTLSRGGSFFVVAFRVNETTSATLHRLAGSIHQRLPRFVRLAVDEYEIGLFRVYVPQAAMQGVFGTNLKMLLEPRKVARTLPLKVQWTKLVKHTKYRLLTVAGTNSNIHFRAMLMNAVLYCRYHPKSRSCRPFEEPLDSGEKANRRTISRARYSHHR